MDEHSTVDNPDPKLTSTWAVDLNPPDRRTVARNTDEVMSCFFARSRPDFGTSNFRASAGTLFSYAMPIARWVIRRVAEDVPAVVNPVPFLLVRDKQIPTSVTTKTKHISPLVRECGRRAAFDGLVYFAVSDVMACRVDEHKANVRYILNDAVSLATKAGKARVNKATLREAAINKVTIALWYARITGLCGFEEWPHEDTDPGVLADWFREKKPEYNLGGFIQSFCPITGDAVNG